MLFMFFFQDELSKFCSSIRDTLGSEESLNIEQARIVVNKINEFLYTNYEGIGTTSLSDSTIEYFSDFHKYWESHHKEILDCQIDELQCGRVADALHEVYLKTDGEVFASIWDTFGLSKEDVCRVRMLTANQDFRGSRSFEGFAKVFNIDNSIFDEELIAQDPAEFIKSIKISDLSQNDKRESYAQNIAKFVLEHKCSPYEIIKHYNNDVYELRTALINCSGAGYGNKKTDMFLRDMVVLGIWNDVRGFDKIDVASDINTIKVALRTSIIRTAIPLVSSFLDIFCYQYSYIEEMNALAWRRVWEIWKDKYPNECVSSPCLIDYFVYGVIGKQFCKENLVEFKCNTHEHYFKWHSSRNKTCQVCLSNGLKKIKAIPIRRMMACTDPEGDIAILQTEFNKKQPDGKKINNCPFKDICGDNRKLMPPKSISIFGQTGWTSAYSKNEEGGGGLMA